MKAQHAGRGREGPGPRVVLPLPGCGYLLVILKVYVFDALAYFDDPA